MMLSLDQDERRQPQPHLFRVQQGDAPAENALVFEPFQAFPAGRGGQINGIGQRLQREGAIFLQ